MAFIEGNEIDFYKKQELDFKAQLVPLLYSRGRYTHYSDTLHDFSVTIPRCHKEVCVNNFFPLSSHSKTLEFSDYRMRFIRPVI